jgi:hypothetical protein
MSIDLLEKAGEMYVADYKNVYVPNMLTTTLIFACTVIILSGEFNIGKKSSMLY